MIKKHGVLILVLLVLMGGLIVTGLRFAGVSFGFIERFFTGAPSQEELLASIPTMDSSSYNRFLFSININVSDPYGGNQTQKESGALELYHDVSHLYNLKSSGGEGKTESWTDFGSSTAYEAGESGWKMANPKAEKAIEKLADAINNREKDCSLTKKDSVCTLSWELDADLNSLFGTFLSDGTKLTGSGRATAVFDQKTYKFQYFTFIISANSEEQASALLDSVFYWEVQNDNGKALSIPSNITEDGEAEGTGVSMVGEYDPVIGPMAEEFTETYGGSAETVCGEKSASLFWTVKKKKLSATVNYLKTEAAEQVYEEHKSTLSSVYGEPVEQTENSACFYRSKEGELSYMARGDGWYAEIVITGPSGISQGELRKPLITYKAKLGI